MTGSIAAINAYDLYREKPWTESDWTDLSQEMHPYIRSKTLAEKFIFT